MNNRKRYHSSGIAFFRQTLDKNPKKCYNNYSTVTGGTVRYNKDYISMWGNPVRFSRGYGVTMADKQIKRGIKKGELSLQEIGNAKAVVRNENTGKWFMISGGWGNDSVFTAMLGAACGDIAGSAYEFNNIKKTNF